MSRFTAGVEFHAERPGDYEQLDKQMLAVGFKRAAADEGQRGPSPAVYEYLGAVQDEQAIVELAQWAVAKVLSERRRSGFAHPSRQAPTEPSVPDHFWIDSQS